MRRALRLATLVALVAGGVALVRLLLARRGAGAALEPPAPPSWPPLPPDAEAAAESETITREAGPEAGTAVTEAAAGAEPAAPDDVPSAGEPAWAAPVERACPAGYPVKAKVASHVYHLPGMAMYDRTTPDRCYASPADAEADGFRAAKR